ncbi:MAG: hypothetical protein LBH13_01665 [Cellulomonadaceae bacterium]|jgi:putative ABC transport system permease protein|nr:hypothetical protein [Cellulomonadaceae bacterium]
MQEQWSGIPRISDVLRDAWDNARAQTATTITLILVLATVCFAIVVTTGQSAAAEARVIEQIDGAGTRLIALSDDGGSAGILPQAPAAVAALSDVSWAFGLGEARDVTNPILSDGRAAARALIGDMPPDVTLTQGRFPLHGEAMVGIDAAQDLHCGRGLCTVQDVNSAVDPVGVVGVFQAHGPLEHLNGTVLVASDPTGDSALRYVYAMATNVAVVDRLEAVLASSTPADNPAALTVETPAGAIALRDVIAGRLGAASRQLMGVVMGVGAVMIAVTMFATTISRRRDIGRRRALGATRSTLIAGMLLQTALSSCAGAIIGTTAGLIVLQETTASLPSPRFVIAVTGLALLLALVATTPIATHAANRDPLRILRVP